MGAGASRTSLLVKVSATALCVSSFGVERTSAFSLLAEIGAEACVAVLSAKLSSFLDGPGVSELAADCCAGCSALSPPEGLWLIGAGSAESECELRRKFELVSFRSGSRPESMGAKVFFFAPRLRHCLRLQRRRGERTGARIPACAEGPSRKRCASLQQDADLLVLSGPFDSKAGHLLR